MFVDDNCRHTDQTGEGAYVWMHIGIDNWPAEWLIDWLIGDKDVCFRPILTQTSPNYLIYPPYQTHLCFTFPLCLGHLDGPRHRNDDSYGHGMNQIQVVTQRGHVMGSGFDGMRSSYNAR